MKNFYLALMVLVTLALYGCGGAGFAPAIPEEGGDSGQPVADGRTDSGPVVVEPEPEAAATDAGVESGTVADSGSIDSAPPVCTPISSGVVEIPLLGSGYCAVQIPSQFLDNTGNSCAPVSTPAACQCAETYTCACLGNPLNCEFPSCGMRNGVVVVSCN